MKKPGIFLPTIVALLLVSGCNDSGQVKDNTPPQALSEPALQTPATDKRTTSEIIANAKTLHLQARQLGHAWSTTQDHITEAEKLLAAKDMVSAQVSALRAELSASASIAQSHSEQNAWQDRFPK